MGTVLRLVDLNKEFSNSKYKIIVNEYDEAEKNKHLALLEALLLREVGATLDFTPKCLCGLTKGGWKIGRYCDRCPSKVSRTNSDDLNPNTWFKTKVQGVNFIAPGIYAFFDKKIMGNKSKEENDNNTDAPCGNGKFSALGYLSNSKARKHKNMTAVDTHIIEIVSNIKGFKRNFRYFTINFIKICRVIAEIKGGNTGSDMLAILDTLDNTGKEFLYTKYIPIVSGMLVYKTTSNNKVTPTFNAIKNMLLGYIDTARSEEKALADMAIVNYKSACLYAIHVKSLISSKGGIGRKHCMSTKLDFSSRNVCIPTNTIHDIREIHMPYKTSIVLFRLHLANKILKYTSLRDTHKRINDAIVIKDVGIYSMMNDLIQDSDMVLDNGKHYQGIITGRNPGLQVGSILTMALTHIKEDIKDDTMEVPAPLSKLPNYDFDGDFLYVTLPLSKYVYKLFKPMEPQASVNSPKVPGGVYGKINLGPVAPMNISATLRKERREYGD